MIKLLEKELLVKCRKEDLNMLKKIKKEAEQDFKQIMQRETNETYECQLTVLEDEFLTLSEGGDTGGIVLSSKDRKIVCPNTIKDRINLCFEDLLPTIR